jgi:hypothetical protein
MRSLRYVGPDSLRAALSVHESGARMTSPAALSAWLDDNPDALTCGATFVVSLAGALVLADRHSEHVACAGGADVLSAGEIVFARSRGLSRAVRASEITNQSTGYCPPPESFAAVARALDALNVAHEGAFTVNFVFRRCPRCQSINVVKEAFFVCALCDAELPAHWNFDR